MGQEASKSPKERVNIVYKSATGDATEQVELPLKTLVIGDFTGAVDERPIEERAPISVDKDNFSQVLKAQDIAVDLQVADKLSGADDASLPVTLRFETLRDFEPEGIVRQVAPLGKLLELRQALQALKGPMGNMPAFRKKIQKILDDPEARQKLVEELGAATGGAEGEDA